MRQLCYLVFLFLKLRFLFLYLALNGVEFLFLILYDEVGTGQMFGSSFLFSFTSFHLQCLCNHILNLGHVIGIQFEGVDLSSGFS